MVTLVMVLLALCCALSGCSDGPPPPTGPYAQEIARAQQLATSDFEREVLRDGRVERHEYEQAMTLFKECADRRGLEMVLQLQPDTGLYQYQVTRIKDASGNDTTDAVLSECSEGTTRLVEPLYSSMAANPDNASYPRELVACLKREGAVPPSFDEQELPQLHEKNGQGIDPALWKRCVDLASAKAQPT